MIDLKSILEEIARNLGEEKLNTILEVEDPNRPYQDTPLSPAKIRASRAQTPSRVSSSPTKNQTPAQQGARTLRSAGNINIPVNKAVQRASAEDRDSTEIQRNSVVGKALPVAAQKPPSMQANRPSIRSGLNRAGLNTQAGVAGVATRPDSKSATAAPPAKPTSWALQTAAEKSAAQPAAPPAKPTSWALQTAAEKSAAQPAAPSNSSFAPTNVARQAAQNRADAEDRDTREISTATSGRSTPTVNQATAPMPPRRVVSSRPAAAPTPSAPEPKSKQMFQSYSDAAMRDDDSPEAFFAADRQLQKEKPLRESLELTIRKILKG
jgi:hypothetical protein